MAHVNRELGRAIVSWKGQPAGMEVRDGVLISLDGSENHQLVDILMNQMPDMLELFIKKNQEYGAGDPTSGTMLGVKGQFADIWRKIGKLKTALWDGKEDQLTTESVEEILRDLIGHCFLALHMRDAQAHADQEKRTVDHLTQTLHEASEQLTRVASERDEARERADMLQQKLDSGGHYGAWPGRLEAVERSREDHPSAGSEAKVTPIRPRPMPDNPQA